MAERTEKVDNQVTPNQSGIDRAVMARLRAPFGCERVGFSKLDKKGVSTEPVAQRWRIHDAIASVSPLEEGYARLIVQALNEHFERGGKR
jgi:hypothetical protein